MTVAPFDLLEAQRRIYRSGLGALAKLVGLAICDHWSFDAPEPFPSVARLEAWTSLKRDAVMQAIGVLAAAEAIRVLKTPGRVNRYDLTPLMRLEPVGETDQSAKPTSRCGPRDQSAKPTGPVGVADTKEPKKEPNKEPSVGPALELRAKPTTETKAKRSPTKVSQQPQTTLPADWQPTEAHRDLAGTHGLDVALEAAAFRGHAEAKDRRAASWNGAFSTWLANQVRWNQQRGPRRPAEPQRGIATGLDAARMGTESPLIQRMRGQPQQALPLDTAGRRAL